MTSWRILEGDCREMLATLPDASVQTCVTSPPYFGLRDYGTAKWEGGDPKCEHSPAGRLTDGELYDGQLDGAGNRPRPIGGPHRGDGRRARECRHCGAQRVDSQVGLEPTPQEYVAELVAVFREVRRVLRDDGTVWLNLGDSYNAYNGNAKMGGPVSLTQSAQRPSLPGGHGLTAKGLKPKDLMMIPARVALALQDDGWYLRADVVWNKPNPMPEAVTDRPTKSHEYVFLLAKRPRYFYDADAIREKAVALDPAHPSFRPNALAANGSGRVDGFAGKHGDRAFRSHSHAGRNKRSVWTVTTQPYAGAHFAPFPPKLIEPCVLAGSAPQACAECGAPWRRVLGGYQLDLSRPQARRAAELAETAGLTDEHIEAIRAVGVSDAGKNGITQAGSGRNSEEVKLLAAEAKDALGGYFREYVNARRGGAGWEPSCEHGDGSARSVVLDPFAGSGTTGLVATRHGRDFVGCELNPEYVELARRRLGDPDALERLEVEQRAQAIERGEPVQTSLLDLLGGAAA